MKQLLRNFIAFETYFPASAFASFTILSFAVIENSTRRFCALPSGVSLVAIGSAIPKPEVLKRLDFNPFELNKLAQMQLFVLKVSNCILVFLYYQYNQKFEYQYLRIH